MTETLEKKILIVDGNQKNREKVIKVLDKLKYNSTNGYKIEEVDEGSFAVKMAKNVEYHLIIMAWVMKEMNGIQATEKIRKFDTETPIVIMSPGKDPLGVSTIGANAHVNKNYLGDELPLVLQKIYQNKNN
ncbi:response regulator [Candidatus Pacearchaeota archaeon]|nr:response regulator [Candidatus Pacearchaeota archaeon]